MAEAFANRYGADVLKAASAGLAPVQQIPPMTVAAMAEIGMDVSIHMPRRYDPFEALECDLVVNMSGFNLPGPAPRKVKEWVVPDPMGGPIGAFRIVRGDLEKQVMQLILDLRRRQTV